MEEYDGEPMASPIPDEKDVADPAAILDPRVIELYTKSACCTHIYIKLISVVYFTE
jgi:hypothetical protein